MRLKLLLPVLILLGITILVTPSQDVDVRFYPTSDLTLCKKCGELKESFWNFKIRIENRSADDLIVYGTRGKKDFQFLSTFQYRNPDVCEWQYPYGSANNRGGWKARSGYFKQPLVLKAGEILETSGGFVEPGNSIPHRLVAFVSKIGEAEPREIFSEPYIVIPSSQTGPGAANPAAPELRIVDDTCSPACELPLDRSPVVLGIRLGMSLDEFVKLFPKEEVRKEPGYDLKYAFLWNWKEDAYSTSVTFYKDEVIRIETKFKSLEDKRWEPAFYSQVAEKLGLPSFGSAFNSRFECRDFLVDVLTNKDPTITIWRKAYIDIYHAIVEETWRAKKKKKK